MVSSLNLVLNLVASVALGSARVLLLKHTIMIKSFPLPLMKPALMHLPT